VVGSRGEAENRIWDETRRLRLTHMELRSYIMRDLFLRICLLLIDRRAFFQTYEWGLPGQGVYDWEQKTYCVRQTLTNGKTYIICIPCISDNSNKCQITRGKESSRLIKSFHLLFSPLLNVKSPTFRDKISISSKIFSAIIISATLLRRCLRL